MLEHRTERMVLPLAVLVLLALAGCSTLGTQSTGEPLADEMFVHFKEAGAVQSAVVDGNLARAHRLGARMAQEAEAPLPGPEAEYWTAAMVSAARWVAQAPDLKAAALGTANLGATCAGCHRALAAGPVFAALPESEPGESQEGMVLHVRAADLLWEGLIAPSDARWASGAELLASSALTSELLASARGGVGQVGDLRALGVAARNAGTEEERTEIYARLLQTCSGCHTGGR